MRLDTGDAFVTKINPTGSALVYSTYLGGSGGTGALASPWTARATLTSLAYTDSANFPVTPGAFQTLGNMQLWRVDAFVTKINPAGSALVYSTYLGGSGGDCGRGIAVDSAGNAYVTGFT